MGKIILRLNSLIEQEKVYLERTLTLKTLSDKLFISPSQFSECLNSHYKMNYNNYINSYRVEEAKRILVIFTKIVTGKFQVDNTFCPEAFTFFLMHMVKFKHESDLIFPVVTLQRILS